jgi:hypothetical protein
MEKIFNHKSFGHLWEVELTYKYTDTGGKLLPMSLTQAANLLPVLLTPVANFPPVSTTLAKLVEKFAAGVVDTSGAP